jgi:hypothetical protein
VTLRGIVAVSILLNFSVRHLVPLQETVPAKPPLMHAARVEEESWLRVLRNQVLRNRSPRLEHFPFLHALLLSWYQ